MFMPETRSAEYGMGGYGGRRWRRRGGWTGQYEADEYGPSQSEYEYESDEYGPGQGEYGGYESESDEYGPGQGEYESDEYGPGQGEYGGYEYESDEYGPGQGEDEYESDEYGQGGAEAEDSEERFLPLIPIVGKVLGGLLGGLVKEAELGYSGELEAEQGEAEVTEAEEELLGRILKSVLGQEAEHGEAVLSPAQEAEFASQLLEVADEQELEQFLGGVVNAVGRAVQGIGSAVSSPQGRALVKAVAPVIRTALASAGGPGGASLVLEGEMPGLDREQEEYEAARRLVQMTAAAAHDVATAPPDAPPRMVGELGVIRAARRFAAPLFRRALRAVTPYARRYYGPRYAGFRRYGYRGYGWRGYGYRRYGSPSWPGYRRYGAAWPYGYPQGAEPPPEPSPEPPAPSPQPGFRWVAVPIGAPAPQPEPPAEPPQAGPPPGAPAPGGGPQSEFGWGDGGRRRRYGATGPSGRWVRRGGKIILLGA